MITNTVLNTRLRPTVLFNVQNPDHRYWGWRFIKQKTWSGCPYMFALPQSEPNVYTMVTRLMSEYYADREFESVAIEPQQPRIRAVL
jgi:hypothetical protein